MKDVAHPIVLYVPGLLPKPESGVHRDALLRCLLAGLERLQEVLAPLRMHEINDGGGATGQPCSSTGLEVV